MLSLSPPFPLSIPPPLSLALLPIRLQDEEWYEPSADVRSQLRFFEQLERMEKQRKDEQEREILLKAAKVSSSSRPTLAQGPM